MTNNAVFRFDLDDSSVMMSHLALQQIEVAAEIAKTSLWKKERHLSAEVKINGIEIPGEIFEELLQHWYKSMERQIEEQTGFLEKADAVENAARRLLEEKAAALVEKMNDLGYHLDNLFLDLSN